VESSELAAKLHKQKFYNYVNSEAYFRKFDFSGIVLEQELARLAKRFKFAQFRLAIFPEHFWYTGKEEKYYLRLVAFLRFYEDVFLKKRVTTKYFVQYVGDFIPYYARKIAARIFSQYSLFCGGFLIFDRFNITPDFQGRWIIDNYEIEPTYEEREFIKGCIAKEVREKSLMVPGSVIKAPAINKQAFYKSIPYFFKKIFKRHNEIGSELIYKIRENLQPAITARLVKSLYKSVDLKKTRYFYFPLHYIYDSSLTSMAEPFVNQYYLVELIHRFLPHGFKLLVKEHPAAIGTTPYRKLKKLTELPDLVLLPANLNSHDIIANANVVVVIASSVGVEALYQNKSVITFGDSYYTGQGVTIDVRNLLQLPQKIVEAIDFRPDKEKIIKMFTRIYRDSYPIDQRPLIESFQNNSVAKVFSDAAPKIVVTLIDYCEKKLPKKDYKKYLIDASVTLPYCNE
jgi:hypothetical protein